MSRRLGEPEVLPIFPPARGLYKPYRVSNTLINSGRAIVANHWRFNNNVLSSREGNTPVNAGGTLTSVFGISSYAGYNSGAGAAQRDILIVDNDTLYYVDTVAGTTLHSVGTFAGAALERCPIVRFRSRMLIGVKGSGLYWYDPAARTMRIAGVPIPATNAAGAAGAAGVPNGTYGLVYTNVNDQGHESNPSPAVTGVVIVNQHISWSSIDVGPAGTSKRRLYRTTGTGAGEYFFLAEIADNVTTTYDDNIADAALGALVDQDNTIPVTSIRQMCVSRSRVFILDSDGLTVWASKIDATTGLPNWEAFPTKLSLNVAFSGGDDSGKAIAFANGDIYVWGGTKLVRIVGDVATGVTIEEVLNEGIMSPFAFCQLPDETLVFMNTLKQIKHYRFDLQPITLSDDIQDSLEALVLGYFGGLPFGRGGPHLVHDIKHDAIEVHFSTSDKTNNKAYCYDRASKQWTSSLVAYDISHYSEFFGDLYGWTSAHVDQVYASVIDPSHLAAPDSYINYGTLFSATFLAAFELMPWSPSPGDDIDFTELQILVKAIPAYSSLYSIFPGKGFNVWIALNGANRWRKRRCYIPADGIAVTTQSDRAITRALSIPVNRIAKTISIRIERPVEDTGHVPMYPLEIAGIQVVCTVLSASRDARKFHGGEGFARASN